MANKTNEFLGMMKIEVDFNADGDGDVVGSVRSVETVRIMTEDLEYIVGSKGKGVLPMTEGQFEYRNDPDLSLLASIENALREALATRPNRSRD
jgi:hypothetical protein